VEIGGKELVRLAGKLMRPAVVALALRSMLSKSD
jgi:hypothetical protein